MESEILEILKIIYMPSSDSHKGQNGRLLIIGGSHLFHSASIWALQVASRIVDLVHFASTQENNKIVHELKKEFRNGIVISRENIEDYIEEDDCILIGPGLVRAEKEKIINYQLSIVNLTDILKINDEGIQTYYLTKYLLTKYPHKKWVIDAGALQMLEPEWIPKTAILTPHHKEFEILKQKGLTDKKYDFTMLLKGEADTITSKEKVMEIKGGNAGMTKGGTGDVLSGLVAALYCKNDAFVSAVCASYLNKKAGEDLEKTMGLWFNASDLADQIPKTMKKLLPSSK